jgi:uncharacterized FlaG/YvyC family protein
MTEQERKNKVIESEVIDLLKIKNRLQAQDSDPAIKRAIERIEEAVESLNSYIAYNTSREEIMSKVI